MTQLVRKLADGEELVYVGWPPNDTEDPRERMPEARGLASDDEFEEDFDQGGH
jgi:hypothetical protein